METYNKLINQNITITANDASLITHVWSIKKDAGEYVIQSANTSSFTTSFSEVGTYTIKHEGSVECGSYCTPVENTIVVSETPVIEAGTSPLFVFGLGIGFLYIITKKKGV